MNQNNKKKGWGKTILTLVIGAVFGAVLGGIVGPYVTRWSAAKTAYAISYNQQILSVYNRYNELIGKSLVFPSEIDTAFVWQDSGRKPLVAVGTVDGKVFIINPKRKTAPTPEEGFQLFVDSVVKEHTNSNRFRIGEIGILDWDGDGIKEIFVNSVDAHWYPARLVVLDKEMKLLYEYWNYGGIAKALPVDIDEDGEDELVILAYNHGRRHYTALTTVDHPLGVALLDRSQPSGQAPDSVYLFYSAGVTKWNLVWVGPEITNVPIGNAIEIEYEEGEPVVRIQKKIGLILYVDKDGNVVKLGTTDAWRYNVSAVASVPEPWLVNVERRNGKVIEIPIPIRDSLKAMGYFD